MKKIFSFWEKVEGFEEKVLNEREVRASAWILFVFSFIWFINAWLEGNFYIIQIFVLVFFIDFFIRLFINPKFSPTMILGRIFVENQVPEYVWAKQKKFAWGIGLVFSIIIIYALFVEKAIWMVNFFICFSCLFLLWFESMFGICLGCKMYNLFNKQKATNCPGWTCEIRKKEEIQKVSFIQIFILIFSIIAIIFSYNKFNPKNNFTQNSVVETKWNQKVFQIKSNKKWINCKMPNWLKCGKKK